MRDQRGASLVEVMGASAILGIVVAAFLALSQYLALSERATDTETEALRLAEQRLARASAHVRDYGAPPADEPDADGFSVAYRMTLLGEGDDPVEYEAQSFGPKHLSLQTVVPVASGGLPLPALLTVTVSWGDSG